MPKLNTAEKGGRASACITAAILVFILAGLAAWLIIGKLIPEAADHEIAGFRAALKLIVWGGILIPALLVAGGYMADAAARHRAILEALIASAGPTELAALEHRIRYGSDN